MSNWKKYKLGEIGTLARGKSKHRPRDAEHLYGGRYPFVQTGDIKNANHRLIHYTQTYSEAGLLQSKLWPKDTVCITIAANIADTAILDFPACFPDSVLGFIANKTLCNVDYIEYMLQYFKQEVQKHSIGSVQENINLGTFENVYFPLPNLPIQTRIASILSALDNKIELNRRMNQTLEQMAATLFKKYFVDDIDPDNLPEGWRWGKLSDIAEFSNGFAFSSKDLSDENQGDSYHVFKMGHIKKGGGFNSDGTKSFFEKKKALGLEKYILKKGDLLMCMTDMKDSMALLGHTALMNEEDKFIVNQRVGLIRANIESGINYPFLYLLTNSNDFIEDLRRRANSGVQVNLSTSEIKNSVVLIPRREKCSSFDQLAIPIFEKIFSLDKENQKLSNIRDTLLPKFLSGEIDLSTIQQNESLHVEVFS